MSRRKVPHPPPVMGEIRKRLRGSSIIYDNRDALAEEMLRLAGSKITPTRNGDQVEVELIDKVRVLQMLAKSAGLLDQEKEVDKPSVVAIEMVMPGEKDGTTKGS